MRGSYSLKYDFTDGMGEGGKGGEGLADCWEDVCVFVFVCVCVCACVCVSACGQRGEDFVV